MDEGPQVEFVFIEEMSNMIDNLAYFIGFLKLEMKKHRPLLLTEINAQKISQGYESPGSSCRQHFTMFMNPRISITFAYFLKALGIHFSTKNVLLGGKYQIHSSSGSACLGILLSCTFELHVSSYLGSSL